MAEFIDVIRRIRKLSSDEEDALKSIEWYTTPEDRRILRGLIKERKISIGDETLSVGGLVESVNVPKITIHKKSEETADLVREVESRIDERTKSMLFKEFAKAIHDKCSQIIAPNIVGFETVKKAAALQLFSPERIHILLLGDPGTGKTQILSSVNELALVSSMGLGSGTSGVGLAVTIKGNEVKKGLLPMADNGICAIDELNLMKEESRASLYNAMEKGFVSYDKGGHSFKFDSRVSVLATANPKGDSFTGTTVDRLKKQMPFDPALLSRFHLVFFVRKHNIEEFKRISKSLLSKSRHELGKKEAEFFREYIKQAHAIGEVSLPKKFEQEIVDFVADIKENEKKYLIEVSPRLVVGFARMAKASARMELRSEVAQKDVNLVKEVVRESLKT
jgi:DNA replicative helicase MCM subunit Mcm2 (Cdc46/Mcm family)